MKVPANFSADRLILDYLSRVTVAGLHYLPKGKRIAFVGSTRSRIERECGPVGLTDPARVREVLASLGEPEDLVRAERARLDAERIQRQNRAKGTGDAAPAEVAAPLQHRRINSRWKPATPARPPVRQPGDTGPQDRPAVRRGGTREGRRKGRLGGLLWERPGRQADQPGSQPPQPTGATGDQAPGGPPPAPGGATARAPGGTGTQAPPPAPGGAGAEAPGGEPQAPPRHRVPGLPAGREPWHPLRHRVPGLPAGREPRHQETSARRPPVGPGPGNQMGRAPPVGPGPGNQAGRAPPVGPGPGNQAGRAPPIGPEPGHRTGPEPSRSAACQPWGRWPAEASPRHGSPTGG